MTKRIKMSEIEDEVLVCPYCMNDVLSYQLGCCGESSSHFETGYIVDGECFLSNKVELVDDLEYYCFMVRFQLNDNIHINCEFVKALNENEAERKIKWENRENSVSIKEVSLISDWSQFETSLNRTYQGD